MGGQIEAPTVRDGVELGLPSWNGAEHEIEPQVAHLGSTEESSMLLGAPPGQHGRHMPPRIMHEVRVSCPCRLGASGCTSFFPTGGLGRGCAHGGLGQGGWQWHCEEGLRGELWPPQNLP